MRAILKAILVLIVIVVVVAAAASYYFGYRVGSATLSRQDRSTVGTSGRESAPHGIDSDRGRETASEGGRKLKDAGREASGFLSDAAVTAKVKSKMALDDTLHSTGISVETDDGVVTLSGRVATEAEHRRAVATARGTDGVKRVVDRLEVTR